MSQRLRILALCASLASLSAATGCDGGASTGTAPVAHDQDKTAGHMVSPAGGPNSPMAKQAKAAAK